MFDFLLLIHFVKLHTTGSSKNNKIKMRENSKIFKNIIFSLVVILIVITIIQSIQYNYNGGPFARREKDGRFLVEKIEEYKKVNGIYPQDLIVLNIKSYKFEKDKCTWQYHKYTNDNEYYELTLGNYDADCQFILRYSSINKKWYLDS